MEIKPEHLCAIPWWSQYQKKVCYCAIKLQRDRIFIELDTLNIYKFPQIINLINIINLKKIIELKEFVKYSIIVFAAVPIYLKLNVGFKVSFYQ